MPKQFSHFNWIESKYLFYIVLLLNLGFLCITKFFPSMDGPAHLYNANLLIELFRGNETVQEFYTINPVPIPNWTAHIILACCQLFLPAWFAEKVLLILYVSGMALSFRYLIRTLKPENAALSMMIFPFIYSFLFHLGFYNFCISFILFFMTLGHWLRTQSKNEAFNYFLLFILITLTYFTNVLMFGFIGLTLGLFIIGFTYFHHLENNNLPSVLRFIAGRLFGLVLVSLPGLILLLIFYRHVNFFPTDQHYHFKELLKWIHDARPFIVYNYNGEKVFTRFIMYGLIILLANGLFHRKDNGEKQNLFIHPGNILGIPMLISLILLFTVPNGSGAGMMSDRYCLIFFIFLLTWTVFHAVPGRITNLTVLALLILHFSLSFKHMNGTIRQLNANAASIYEAGRYINKNSVVLPVNLSDNWLEPHFSNYLGVEKPVIILENYEANVDWFPIQWRKWIADKNQRISYVLLYGSMRKLNTPERTDLKYMLSSDFTLKYESANHYVFIYQKNQAVK